MNKYLIGVATVAELAAFHTMPMATSGIVRDEIA